MKGKLRRLESTFILLTHLTTIALWLLWNDLYSFFSGSREHALTLLTSSPLPPTIEPPSPGPEPPEDRRSKRLKTSRQAWESEETTDNEDILDRFLKVKQFANHQMSSYESMFYQIYYTTITILH